MSSNYAPGQRKKRKKSFSSPACPGRLFTGTILPLLHFHLLLLMLLVHCQSSEEYTYNKFVVGAYCEVTFVVNDPARAQIILADIDKELIRIDSLCSRFSHKSMISELNRESTINAPDDIIQLFFLSDSISRVTDGLFDISIAPLLEIWGFYTRSNQIPSPTEILAARALVDYRKIHINDNTITLAENMAVDLGGIAQGYAADQVAAILKENMVTSALINIGGEIIAYGQAPSGRPWRIGIQHPRGEGIIEAVDLANCALSTSGDYEKFFMVGDKRYPHIINPTTGYPATDFASVTVFSERAAFADAMATAVAILGPEKGLKFLDSLRIRAIIYYERDGQLQRVHSKG